MEPTPKSSDVRDGAPAPSARIDAGTPGPVQAAERIASIDVLRGMALLGILVINLQFSFADAGASFFDPTVSGPFEGANKWLWWVSYLVFDEKMMSLFSMLFGAGVLLQTRRADEQGVPQAGLYYRRMGWLLVFGAIHGYVLWYGDILAGYAMCGFWLYGLRRLSPKKQIVLGLVVMFMAVPVSLSMGLYFHAQEKRAEAYDAAVREGREPAADLEQGKRDWETTEKTFGMSQEEIDREIAIYGSGTFGEQFRARVPVSFQMETIGYLLFTGPRGGGLMLLGMALLQLGIITGARSTRFYAGMTLAGYLVGLPLAVLGGHMRQAHGWNWVDLVLRDNYFNYYGSLFVAMGHMGVVMLVCRNKGLSRLTRPFGNVGQTAFSCYILQTVLATTVFYSWGFAQFGRLDRAQMAGVVVGIWVVEIVLASLWLARFRFGPLEWIWRSLTYGKIQPLRRAPEGATQASK
ncbi:MAG: DUF418 domain-containing protein [Planctomycetes bacterium]|nr:DUF418 domain-containing protein [Planctomycetota bacterium]